MLFQRRGVWRRAPGVGVARPIWNGAISFGLLNVPVQLYSGERSVDLHFRLLDARDQSPIRYERINSESGEIGAFVQREAISPVYFEKPYYLVPRKKAEKGYALLRETLKRTGRVGIGKVVIRTRQYLAALMAQDQALILDLMRFPQELVAADEFDLPSGQLSAYHVSDRELEMAGQLVDAMTTPFRPQDYRDDFRDRLRAYIERRVAAAGGAKLPESPTTQAARPSTNVVDFMALLEKSLESKGRGESKGKGKPARRAERAAPAAEAERSPRPRRHPRVAQTGAGASTSSSRPRHLPARRSSAHGRRTH
jgi:DNA end-binding protein Ku